MSVPGDILSEGDNTAALIAELNGEGEDDSTIGAEVAAQLAKQASALSGAKLTGTKPGKGFTIVDQMFDLKKKTNKKYLSIWKPKLLPSEKEREAIIKQRTLEREARTAAIEAKSLEEENNKKRDERERAIARERAKMNKLLGVQQAPKAPAKEPVPPPETLELLETNVEDIEKRKVYEHFLHKYGSVEFNNLMKRRSLYQLRDAKSICTGLHQTLNGVKGVMSRTKRAVKIISVTQQQFEQFADKSTNPGTLIILNPTTHTYDGILDLHFTYTNIRTNEEDHDILENVFSDGCSFGYNLTTTNESEGTTNVVRNLPGWEGSKALWVPGFDITCEYEVIEEPIIEGECDLGFMVVFHAFAFKDKNTAYKALRKTSNDIIKKKMKSRAASLTVNGGIPALEVAAFYDNKQLIRFLLDAGADPSKFNNYDHSTALHEAVKGGNVQAIEMLLAAGANQTVRNSMHQTPLHVACVMGDVFVVKALCRGALAKKAAQMTDKDGLKPNQVCSRSYCRNVLESIMKDSHLAVRPPREKLV